MMRANVVVAILAHVAFQYAAAQAAADGPAPPCAGEPYPLPAADEKSLDARVWFPPDGEDKGHWSPPACTGWEGEEYSILAASAGRFRHEGTSADLLARIGAISRLTSIRYWSVSRGRWRPLIADAAALSHAEPASRRADFAPAELEPGQTLHFLQKDNDPTGPVIYRLEIRERGPDRIVFAVTNVTPVTLFILTLVPPGGHEFLYFLEREQGTFWRYYSLYRARLAPSPLPRHLEASMINRVGAIFRHIAGMPTDLEPPPARE